MQIIPSLYLKDSKTLHFEGGSGLYFENPFEMAAALESAGAESLYVTDHNLPATGVPSHLPIIESIKKETSLKIFISGNFKSNEVAEKYFDAGVEHVILGSVAYQKPDFLRELVSKHPKKIGLSIDVRAGKVNIRGYAVAAHKTALDYAEQFEKIGVGIIFYSDQEIDGIISTGDIERTGAFAEISPLPIVYSAEILTPADLDAVLKLKSGNILGALIGKSMYTGSIDIAASITHSKERA